MPKMDFLDHQEAEKIDKQKWKQFFQNQRSKTKRITKPVEIFWIDISKCYSLSETMAYFLALIVDFSTSY